MQGAAAFDLENWLGLNYISAAIWPLESHLLSCILFMCFFFSVTLLNRKLRGNHNSINFTTLVQGIQAYWSDKCQWTLKSIYCVQI